MSLQFGILAVALSLSLQPPLSATQWNKGHFAGVEVLGDSGTVHLSSTTRLLERAFEWCQRLVPAVGDGTAAPFTVIATTRPHFGTARFIEGPFRSYAILDARRSSVEQNVLSSVLRALIRHSADNVPLWVEVGVAEFISSVRIDARGKLTLGTPIAGHVLTLRHQAMLPMATILGATVESGVFRDLSQRRLFEAQAWVVVHYLMLGDERRRTHIGSYVTELLAGRVPEEAFRHVFQGDPEALGHLVSDYVARATFRSHSEEATTSASGAVQFTNVEERDASMIIADALVQDGNVAAALRRFRQLPSQDALFPNALGLLARVRSVEGNRAEAIQTFSESTSNPEADDRWRYYFAATLLNAAAPIQWSEVTAADARRAEQELLKLRTRHPNHADVLALLGISQLVLENPGGAIKYLSDAFRLCPRHRYALLLGRARIASGDTAGAQRLLMDLASRGRTQAVRDEASSLLARIEKGPLQSLASIPVYRTPNADELKTAGHLTEITCAPNSIIFHITSENRVLRLAAGSFERVELLSYKRGAPQVIRCGKREVPDLVWAIWRSLTNAPEGVDGFVRSIEFIARER